MTSVGLRIVLAGVLMLAAAVAGVRAQVPQAPPPLAKPQPPVAVASPAPGGLKDPAELEAFLDGVVAAQKESNHVEGLALAVVANGRVFFAKGYGFADRAAGRKVDAERTLFRVGSVSKLFTWTAVMQQVERGKIDLHADVDRYLAGSPVHVPDAYSKPVTMTSLLTHTPGFEDVVLGLFARSPDSMRPLGDLLAAEMPMRVRPPGVLASYSNHGTALAGYIVERVSGVPFEQYVEREILQPLGMSHTTVRQPVPKALGPDMSVGYRWADGEHKPQAFEYVPALPAGAVSATAADMTRFMLAHLQDGRYGEARILSEATARQMHSRLFGHVASLNGMLHGFYEMNRNGRRIYGHGGDTLWFHTELALLPDEQVGLFVSCNADSCAPARSALVKAFVDRYFPAPPAPETATVKRQDPPGTFAGSYRSIRRSYRSLAKLAGLVETVSVSELPDGRLRTAGIGGNPRRWVAVAPSIFRDAEGDDRIGFLRDRDGRVTHLVADFPAIAFERLGPLEASTTHFWVMGVSLAVLLTAAIGWPIAAWRGRGRRAAPRSARLALWASAVLLLAFVAGVAAAMADPMEIVFGVPRSLRVALALPLAAVVLTAVSLVFAVAAWRRRYWRVAGRLYYTLVALSATALLVVLWYWNLIGYHLQ